MGKIVVFHSFQDGIGKTTLLSNLALELATQGKKIGLLDFDLQSPSLHVPFGISQNKIKNSMNDFLKNKVKLSEVPIEIIENHLYLFPCSLNSSDIVEIIRDGFDSHKLIESLKQVTDQLNFDFLFIDTPSGINEDALLACSISEELFLVLKPDKHHIEGCKIFLEFANKISAGKIGIIINKCPNKISKETLTKEIESQLKASMVACMPYDEKIQEHENSGFYIQSNPGEQLSKEIQRLSKLL